MTFVFQTRLELYGRSSDIGHHRDEDYVIDIFGGGVGEGLAAVCGHQSGAKGIWVVKPTFSREIEMAFGVIFRFPAPSPVFSSGSLKRCERFSEEVENRKDDE